MATAWYHTARSRRPMGPRRYRGPESVKRIHDVAMAAMLPGSELRSYSGTMVDQIMAVRLQREDRCSSLFTALSPRGHPREMLSISLLKPAATQQTHRPKAGQRRRALGKRWPCDGDGHWLPTHHHDTPREA
ncbi:hypothetical protein XPA_001246 [Xanthoria parietina]